LKLFCAGVSLIELCEKPVVTSNADVADSKNFFICCCLVNRILIKSEANVINCYRYANGLYSPILGV
jgi:hypothetical protein